jgi:hypothetical protein
MTERYEDWKARMEREGVPDPPVVFADNWARKVIEELREERDRLREALREIVEADPVDLALDPTWPQRIAGAALEALDGRTT